VTHNRQQYNQPASSQHIARFWPVLAGLWLLLTVSVSFADPARIYLIYDNNDQTHQSYVAAFKTELNRISPAVGYIDLNPTSVLRNEKPLDADIYISIGVDAANAMQSVNHQKPTLYALLPIQHAIDNKRLPPGCAQRCAFSVLDQPVQRQIRLIQHSLPNIKRVGVLYSAHSEIMLNPLREQAKKTSLEITAVRHNPSQSLLDHLSPILANAELLFALPDPDIYNKQTARSIILTTYRRGIPIFGYSEAYTRAGALVSLYTTPEQFARHNAEIAAMMLQGIQQEYGIIYPKYFTVSVNQTVAKSLEIELDAAVDLTNWLRSQDVSN